MSLFTDLSDPVFDGVGLAGFKSRVNAFLLARSALSLVSLLFYLLLPYMGWWCGVGVFGLIEYSHSLPALRRRLLIIIIITNAHSNFIRIIIRQKGTPWQIQHCTTNCIPINLIFKKNFPTNTQVWNSLSHRNDCRQRGVI